MPDVNIVKVKIYEQTNLRRSKLKFQAVIYGILMVLLGPLMIFGPLALLDYYLFSPYWILIILGVPFFFFLVLTLLIDFFSGMKRESEASGFVVATGLMLAGCWMMLAPMLTFVVPYYIVKFIWTLFII
jgi:hypothetical protein